MSIVEAIRGNLAQLFNFMDSGGEKAYEPTPLKAMREITNTESFAALLPHCAFHEVEGLFVLDTGERNARGKAEALGMCIEITPQTGATEEMINILAPIVGGAPGNTGVYRILCKRVFV
ncbi:MAG: hypothetical protein ABIV04_11865 [Massilia sp.]